MNLNDYLAKPGELPLDHIPADGAGFTGIFRTIGCIGDSLSSGEFESLDEEGKKGYHDYFEYSWGQYMARAAGCKVYNFSRGGMTASEYVLKFAEANDFWNPDKLCQAYIIALGVNDLFGQKQELGSIEHADAGFVPEGTPSFAYYYSRIILRLREMQPQARFFLMSMPRGNDQPDKAALKRAHARLLHQMAEKFPYTYVLDFNRYAPVYNEDFQRNFYLGGHLNPMGYLLTARMTAAYIDYIIRHNMEDFAQVGFIGKPFHNVSAKW